MKRDPIRLLAWWVFGVGAAVLLLTKPIADIRYQASLITWKRMVAGLDRWTPSPPDPNYAGGFIAGGFLAGLGMLVLGVRLSRPAIAVGTSAQKPGPDMIGAALAESLSKAAVAVVPPWERGESIPGPTELAARTQR